MKTIYLCGGINKLSDSDAKDWREAAKAELGDIYAFLDPMRRDYRGKEAESVFQIIVGDQEDIRHSDILLVNATRPSWGTGMELYMAYKWGKHVITVCPDDHPSPWLVGHSHKIVKSFAEAFALLREICFSHVPRGNRCNSGDRFAMNELRASLRANQRGTADHGKVEI